MPNTPLPSTDFLGDGQRTTAEFQAAIDQVQNWLLIAQSELDALSDTTFGEAAVRGVGTGATDLVDTSALESRLSPTLVWSGNETTVDLSELSDKSAGFYVVRYNSGLISTSPVDVLVYKTPGEQWASSSGDMDITGNTIRYEKVQINENSNGFGSIIVRLYTYDIDTGVNNSVRPILEIYKI